MFCIVFFVCYNYIYITAFRDVNYIKYIFKLSK